MDVVQPGVGHEAKAVGAELATKIDVFACLERRVETTDLRKRRAAHGHVSTAEPVDDFRLTRVPPQPVVQPLDPGGWRGRPAGRADGRDRWRRRACCSAEGTQFGANLMVGVDEREDVASRGVDRLVAELAEPDTWQGR